MSALAPTTTEALGEDFTAAILAVVPRIVVGGGEAWSVYERKSGAAANTRRFRLVWRPLNFTGRGIFTPAAQEVEAELLVRVDYARGHDENQHLAEDDWHQLRKHLHDARGTNTGLVLVITRSEPRVVRRISASGRSTAVERDEDRDVLQIDLPYTVRYLKAS